MSNRQPTNADLNRAVGFLDEALRMIASAEALLQGAAFRVEVNWTPTTMADVHSLVDEVAEQVAALVE